MYFWFYRWNRSPNPVYVWIDSLSPISHQEFPNPSNFHANSKTKWNFEDSLLLSLLVSFFFYLKSPSWSSSSKVMWKLYRYYLRNTAIESHYEERLGGFADWEEICELNGCEKEQLWKVEIWDLHLKSLIKKDTNKPMRPQQSKKLIISRQNKPKLAQNPIKVFVRVRPSQEEGKNTNYY